MPDIKTRDVVKGTVKTIDKSAVAAERMKDAYIRTKDKAEHGIYSADNSPNEYAADRITGSAESAAREAVHQFDKQGRRGIRTTKENISKAKEHIRQKKADIPKKQAQRQAQKKAADRVRHTADTAKKSIKTVERGEKNIKQTAKSTGKVTIKSAKGSVKTAQKTIKTAEQTAKTAIKTTQQAAKVAQKTAQATARAARAAAHAARAAAKGAVSAVRGMLAAARGLVAAIAAGGWIAVAVILVICMAAFLVGSCFGIFFGSPDSEAQSIRQVVAGLDADYMGQLERIKANISHDVLEMSGSRAGWQEVLAVYAVRVAANPHEPQQVATMDEGKKAILTDIFWQMNGISSRTESRTEEIIIETDDGNGNIVETVTTVTRTYLYITVTGKSADVMADQYGFTEKQREQLAELLDGAYNAYWETLIQKEA